MHRCMPACTQALQKARLEKIPTLLLRKAVKSQYSAALVLHKLRELFKIPRLKTPWSCLTKISRFLSKDLLFKSPGVKPRVDYRC